MKYLSITSTANPIIKEAIKVKERHSNYRNDAFLIEGLRLIGVAAVSPDAAIKKVFFTEDFSSKREGRQLLKLIAKKDVRLIETSKHILSKLTDTETPQGVVAVVSYRLADISGIRFKGIPLLVICDGIQDAGNLGTIIRVSDAVNADAVIILPDTCNVFMPKTVRATAGSLFNIPIVHSEYAGFFDYIDSKDINLYAADIHSDNSIYETDLKIPLAIAFGNEARGVSKPLLKMAKRVFRIPIFGKAESLNVAMAASICLYETVRQRLSYQK
ncbi:MAG: RNA methyltransferase [Thermodesulfovibrio sp.]|nr:RNA methyltransferase [Thermodesulfovibrio sp.]